MGKKVVVFGSFIVDMMGRASHLPKPGETVKGTVFKMGAGGKGFNQGVAAHKAGANVAMVTKVGRDSFADVALNMMKELGMGTDHILFSDTAKTGCALIMVEEKTSQNKIVVIPGACNTITDQEADSLEDVLDGAAYLLMQLETNVSAVERVAQIAVKKGVPVILNPAPAQPITDQLLENVELITPNEIEAEILTGIAIDREGAADQAAEWFFKKKVKKVLITLGERGVYVNTGDKKGILPAYQVEAADTTGAGDGFNGGLLTALAEGKDLWEAASFANAVAALSVQKIGAAPSMPERSEIDAFIRAYS